MDEIQRRAADEVLIAGPVARIDRGRSTIGGDSPWGDAGCTAGAGE
ncbi:hypothetical protein [Burkholderia sp. Bp9140]